MKGVRLGGIALLVYGLIVLLFESLIGYFQPADTETMLIRTTDSDGVVNERVLSRIESDGQVYAASNHWFRSWYHQALENPDIQVTFGDETTDYRAVSVSNEAEHDRIDGEHPRGPVLTVLMGFAPRYLVRFEPR
jgi:hypothetical protein